MYSGPQQPLAATEMRCKFRKTAFFCGGSDGRREAGKSLDVFGSPATFSSDRNGTHEPNIELQIHICSRSKSQGILVDVSLNGHRTACQAACHQHATSQAK
ncbi:hypothetical protein NE237_004325 [Protea cynaroides]|uniref:Uncharacterized protein n=1 Tax=Protea cynaroides TaxID=273540 RepID=A0A9Q0KJ86_9MAGN|nr:hypothetical protein NE237_004325 [Protea cynaroides]